MSAHTHTPGPWFSDSKGCVWRRHPRDLRENGGSVAGDQPIATCHRGWHGENETSYSFEANASLMAAAPELLAALERIFDLPSDCPCEVSNDTLNAYDQARAAIAKARGGGT